jgi:hypothetical protein
VAKRLRLQPRERRSLGCCVSADFAASIAAAYFFAAMFASIR